MRCQPRKSAGEPSWPRAQFLPFGSTSESCPITLIAPALLATIPILIAAAPVALPPPVVTALLRAPGLTLRRLFALG